MMLESLWTSGATCSLIWLMKTMSEPSDNAERLFRISFRTVEYFGIALMIAYWLLLLSGFEWGDKFHYRHLLVVSLPVMIVLALSAFLTWRRYRRDSLLHIAVLLAWGIWAVLPRL